MKWLKRRLQKWLGIEATATRLSEIDLQITSLILAVYPDISEPSGELPGLIPQDAEEKARAAIKKGYEKE